MTRVKSLLRMCLLLGYSFEPRPNRCSLGTAGSVTIIGLSVNRCSHSVNQFDERKQDWLVQKFGLRRLQRIDVIRAEPPLLFSFLLDKRRLARRVLYEWLHLSLQKFAFISVPRKIENNAKFWRKKATWLKHSHLLISILSHAIWIWFNHPFIRVSQ